MDSLPPSARDTKLQVVSNPSRFQVQLLRCVEVLGEVRVRDMYC